MRMILLYASKYGAAKELASKIANATQAEVMDIKGFHGSIEDYGDIIFGSSVYAGMMRKEVKKFIKEHEEQLKSKRVFVYLSALNKNDSRKVITENINEAFYEHLSYVDTLGGILDLSNMNMLEKGIIKMMNKKAHFYAKETKNKRIDLLDEQRIQKFIQMVKQ